MGVPRAVVAPGALAASAGAPPPVAAGPGAAAATAAGVPRAVAALGAGLGPTVVARRTPVAREPPRRISTATPRRTRRDQGRRPSAIRTVAAPRTMRARARRLPRPTARPPTTPLVPITRRRPRLTTRIIPRPR